MSDNRSASAWSATWGPWMIFPLVKMMLLFTNSGTRYLSTPAPAAWIHSRFFPVLIKSSVIILSRMSRFNPTNAWAVFTFSIASVSSALMNDAGSFFSSSCCSLVKPTSMIVFMGRAGQIGFILIAVR